MLSTLNLEQAEGYGLTTARITYHLPDHVGLLQDFLWQHYDLCPQFPSLRRFLAFWEAEIEGRVHSITVAHARLIHPVELKGIGTGAVH